jgi:hypothetical protein
MFCIANDINHYRRYYKVLTKDLSNSKQSVTDIYNMFLDPQILSFYPEVFSKTITKREETMSSFTTSTGVKVVANTVGTDQRGQLQEDARPDFIWFDDIGDNMEEARTGLSKDGGCVYTANYISERGNVHRLIGKEDSQNIVMITPILDKEGNPTWPIYTKEEIETIKKSADDFEGEYMCSPSASADVIFDRQTLNKMVPMVPIKEISGCKIFRNFDPAHRYGSGQDVGGGIGLDSSASVIIDFDMIPAQVVSTYSSNEIRPDSFGYEIAKQGERYGECIVAPENNKYDMVIGKLREIYPTDKIYKTQRKSTKVKDGEYTDYGWNTNQLTKPKMFYALSKAVDDGLLELNDINLINEAKSYSRDDVMDQEIDPRLTTRHFDLLTACAIAWMMKDFAEVPQDKQEEENRIMRNRQIRSDASDLGL